MTDLPAITIVTPSFNQGLYLEQTIKSVLDQNYPRLEYMVMDGGSTDNSVEIIKKYARHLTHWESGTDKGHADAIDRGFRRAQGEILCYLNSDDLLLPGALQAVGEWFRDHPAEDWVTGGTLFIDSKNQLVKQRLDKTNFVFGDTVTFQQLSSIGVTSFCQPATFWRKKTYNDVGGIDTPLILCFDFDLFIRFSKKKPSGHLPQFLACFRIHGESKTVKIQDTRLKEDKIIRERYHFTSFHKILFIPQYLRCLIKLQFNKLKLSSQIVKLEKFLQTL